MISNRTHRSDSKRKQRTSHPPVPAVGTGDKVGLAFIGCPTKVVCQFQPANKNQLGTKMLTSLDTDPKIRTSPPLENSRHVINNIPPN
jgi:hypothetical protein